MSGQKKDKIYFHSFLHFKNKTFPTYKLPIEKIDFKKVMYMYMY